MKYLIALLATFAAHADQTPVMTCQNGQVYEQQDNGRYQLSPLGANLFIYKTDNGYRAELVPNAGDKVVETDVDVSFMDPNADQNLRQQTELLAKDVNWNDVARARVGNIDVQANRKESGGFFIIELLDKDSKVLAKLLRAAWAIGICGN
jgi:hypothetical protein